MPSFVFTVVLDFSLESLQSHTPRKDRELLVTEMHETGSKTEAEKRPPNQISLVRHGGRPLGGGQVEDHALGVFYIEASVGAD